jgi:hypothetical protein
MRELVEAAMVVLIAALVASAVGQPRGKGPQQEASTRFELIAAVLDANCKDGEPKIEPEVEIFMSRDLLWTVLEWCDASPPCGRRNPTRRSCTTQAHGAGAAEDRGCRRVERHPGAEMEPRGQANAAPQPVVGAVARGARAPRRLGRRSERRSAQVRRLVAGGSYPAQLTHPFDGQGVEPQY